MGGVIASFDYGQIDARIIACASRDKKYCTSLWEDWDIHMEWAKKLARFHPDFIGGKEYLDDEKKLEDFRSGKVKNNWVFALLYRAGLRMTAQRFGVTEEFIKPMFDEFWVDFKDVRTWQDGLLKQYDELGYIQLFDGLRRRAPLSH